MRFHAGVPHKPALCLYCSVAANRGDGTLCHGGSPVLWLFVAFALLKLPGYGKVSGFAGDSCFFALHDALTGLEL